MGASGSDISEALFEAAPDAILVTRSDGEILRMNRQAERTFGYPRDELVGRSIECLVPEDARERHALLRSRYAEHPRSRAMGAMTSALSALRKDGSTVPVEISLSPVDTSEGRLVIAIARDVSHRRALEEKLRFLSSHDAMTGLYNRAFFEVERDRLDQARGPVSAIMIDIDGLKLVNDRDGHEAGDRLIKRLATVLRGSFRNEDVVARIGGDEFAVLLPGIDASAAVSVVDRLRADLARHNEIHGGQPLAVSIGCASTTVRGTLGKTVLVADRRMYAEKRQHHATDGMRHPV